MKKTGIFNSEISRVIAKLGHKDKIAIVDLGFPIPSHVERIDIVLDFGRPTFEEVLKVILKELEVEQVILAHESSKKFEQIIKENIPRVEFLKISHEELKKLTNDVVAVIRTGDVVPYSNAILVSGVIF
ncbi:high affinity ribose transport protein RbsD [Thermosipho africanus TCF52B]|uniref:D-ribose pyranase n=1 Tax=Thermosipho africanus (strain TCF52B) TaxID=484019 RepID=RBSD_THEAB|nr:D-ribose pyranase [Thermosipho africanus]B7IGD0.1 RecName: Full=D-ribose pyranase [Thermosipho africanus TCF52B]ACJ75144.1 high affinity ribose transport protein RbsD [Thermosipho africanus TCF52B]